MIRAEDEDVEDVHITSRVLADFRSPYDLVLPKHSLTAVLGPEVRDVDDGPGGTPLPLPGAVAGRPVSC